MADISFEIVARSIRLRTRLPDELSFRHDLGPDLRQELLRRACHYPTIMRTGFSGKDDCGRTPAGIVSMSDPNRTHNACFTFPLPVSFFEHELCNLFDPRERGKRYGFVVVISCCAAKDEG
jgi:hypothetical protein